MSAAAPESVEPVMRFPTELVLLTARRVLTPAALLLFGALLALALLGDDAYAPPELARAWRRQTVWGAGLLAVFALVLPRAAAAGRAGREHERDWIGARPVGPGAVVGAEALGFALAAGLLLLATAGVARASLGPGRVGFVRGALLANPGALLVDGDAPYVFELAPGLEARAGDALRLGLSIVPGDGPTVGLRARLERAGGAATEAELRLFGPREVEVAVPPGTGALRLSLVPTGPGAVVAVLPSRLQLLRAAPGRSADLDLLGQSLLAALAWLTLALGLGSWLRPSLAVLAVVALLAVPLVLGGGGQLVPGAGLARAWSDLEPGLGAPLGAAEVLGCVALASLGWLASAAARRRGAST